MARKARGVEIVYLNLKKRVTRGGENLKITKTGVYLSEAIKNQLKLQKGDFLIFGRTGKTTLVGKKPKGVFGGHRLSQGINSERLYFTLKTENYELVSGEFTLGDAYTDTLQTEQGKDVSILMYELIPE